jgi:hypothetical protein
VRLENEKQGENPSKVEKTAKTRLFEDAIVLADQFSN